jgi:phosphoenolpyruvate carboxykinase (ATP)
MSSLTLNFPAPDLKKSGFNCRNKVYYQLSSSALIQATIALNEGVLSDTGALVINTGEFTGRSPKDKFTVIDQNTETYVNWNEFNIPLEENYFQLIRLEMISYLNERADLWVRDSFACADDRYKLPVRIISEKPWTNLFAYNMFLRPTDEELENFDPAWQLISAPGLKLDPVRCGIRQQNASVISFKHKTILIAGSGYTGEIKKAIFTILNYLLPLHHNVLSMHCASNIGAEGDTALFFGLSGTGKTTLSADPDRKLIGDDEHGWSEDGIFNFEGGCYAKTIDLTIEKEPDIYNAIRQGAMVENTPFYINSNRINFTDNSITDNTRVSYPLHYIPNAMDPAIGSIPKNIFFLTCDAHGVLPPISKLTLSQAMYQFISGYTAKVAGTETGITRPVSTFSTCFGAPFLPLHPGIYAKMLGERLQKHGSTVWLVNTGWSGGSAGTGSRMKLSFTRAMIRAALNNSLEIAGFENDPYFEFSIPRECPGVPSTLLNPSNTWSDKKAYEIVARDLKKQFIINFKKYESGVDQQVLAAAPKI